jgi:hypothetical protein
VSLVKASSKYPFKDKTDPVKIKYKKREREKRCMIHKAFDCEFPVR